MMWMAGFYRNAGSLRPRGLLVIWYRPTQEANRMPEFILKIWRHHAPETFPKVASILRSSFFVALVFLATPALAVNWEARITNTNTPLSDNDIQTALSKGLPPSFGESFPGRRYGVHVLLDMQNIPGVPGEFVYLALGLSHRLPNGALELPAGRYSEVLMLPPDASPQSRRDAISQKLTGLAATFARTMIQNKAAFDQTAAHRPQSTDHWTEWPDYIPSTSGTIGGGN